MIELDRHIEILLLSNDCVIVPDLGGFMAHHIEARYDEHEHLFVPPLRTLGFNPQLKLNDSLLAQSYIEAYDISYPEAVRRIEEEVAELRQHLHTEGFYELHDIGVLALNDEGNLTFEPCEAGILTPQLYGLSSFEMLKLQDSRKQTVAKAGKQPAAAAYATVSVADDVAETDETEHAITIKMSWIRNAVAVAAAVLAFFFITPSIDNDSQEGTVMSQINVPLLPKENKKADSKLSRQDVSNVLSKRDTTETTTATAAAEPIVTTTPAPTITTPASATTTLAPTITTPASATTTPASATASQQVKGNRPQYCIVVASQVSQRGANIFVDKLKKQGYSDARVYIHNNIRRVVCGAFTTKANAYNYLQQVHQNDELAEAWVYEMKD